MENVQNYERVDKMIRNGLINEAASMEEFKHLNALHTVGYKEIFPYLNEEKGKASPYSAVPKHNSGGGRGKCLYRLLID